jgi:hypothetical protein
MASLSHQQIGAYIVLSLIVIGILIYFIYLLYKFIVNLLN